MFYFLLAVKRKCKKLDLDWTGLDHVNRTLSGLYFFQYSCYAPLLAVVFLFAVPFSPLSKETKLGFSAFTVILSNVLALPLISGAAQKHALVMTIGRRET